MDAQQNTPRLLRAPYGSRWAELHGEAYRIWLSRAEEPEEPPAFGMLQLLVLSDDSDKAHVLCRQLWQLALQHLNWRQVDVLRFRYAHDLSATETAERMRISRCRVSQIEARALATLRHFAGHSNRIALNYRE
jgi:RNA polymerase sigma factor (sigma-70 family)